MADITFIGKNRLEYGEVFNNNLLHLLEHFASPEDPTAPGTPHLAAVVSPLLQRPTVGQIWYNKTKKRPYVWNGRKWISFEQNDVAAGNSGVIFHLQQIPKPVSQNDGYVYDYSECSWVVSPFGLTESDRIVYMSCYTDAEARVYMQYRRAGNPALTDGYASYQIIGIRDTANHGVPFPTPNVPELTPTPTLTPTMSRTSTPPVSPTVTPTLTRTPGQTRSATPTPTITRTETPVPSVTRTETPTPTPTPTVTATVTPSRPAPIYVDIYDQDIMTTVNEGGDGLVGYTVLNTGNVIVYDSNGMNIPSQWLFNDDPVFYSIRLTQIDGDLSPSTGFLDAWLNLATNRAWEIRVENAEVGTYTARFLVEIKRNVDNFIMDTCEISLTIIVQ